MSPDPSPLSFIVVTPAYNESDHLPSTIVSMVNQTRRPGVWVIVDDGSTDDTWQIVSAAAERFPWIRAVASGPDKQVPGSDGLMAALEAKAFLRGLEVALAVDPQAGCIVKLDADLEFESDYFAKLLLEFESDAELGLAGGTIYEREDGELVKEHINPLHVRGATKVYRRECYDAIGGVRALLGWDVVDELLARDKGWKARPFDPPRLIHLRPTASRVGRFRGWARNGKIAHYLGYSLIRMFVRSMYRATICLDPVHGAGLWWGYFRSWIRRQPRIPDKEILEAVARHEWKSVPVLRCVGDALKGHSSKGRSNRDNSSMMSGAL